MIYCKKIPTPLGEITLVGGETALTHLYFPGESPGLSGESNPLLEEASRQLFAYFQGELQEFSLALHPEGTPFQEKVWQALATIPYGDTWSYGKLAQVVDCPGGARAVGSANGKNPLPILIPCHRVVGGNATLGGYRGGLSAKITLLSLENVRDIDFTR